MWNRYSYPLNSYMLKITKTQPEQDKARQDITRLHPEIMRNLIAATSLVILLKLDSNRCFFSPCDFEMWWMISKNNRAPLLYYIKLCASFQIHRWTQTRLTVRKRSIPVESGDFFCPVWPWNLMDVHQKTKGHRFCTTSSFVHNFKSIGVLKLE